MRREYRLAAFQGRGGKQAGLFRHDHAEQPALSMADRASRTRRVRAWAIIWLALLWIPALSAAAADASGPSFDCKHVSSQVNQLICVTPELSALDRKLSNDYDAMRLQGGIDAKALRADEDLWLRSVRNQCATAACLKSAYVARDQVLLDRSLRAASPAAYDDTRPFPAPASVEAAARSLIGKSCGAEAEAGLPGTSRIKGFLPVVTRDARVTPLQMQSVRFAFLLSVSGDFQHCTVQDVVTLPTPKPGERFMQCRLSDANYGFGLRLANGETVAYWSIDAAAGKLRREPVHVVGVQDLRCQEPETGE